MLNWVLSLLVHTENLTIEEAKHLADKLTTTTHPQRFDDAHLLIEKILSEFHRKSSLKK